MAGWRPMNSEGFSYYSLLDDEAKPRKNYSLLGEDWLTTPYEPESTSSGGPGTGAQAMGKGGGGLTSAAFASGNPYVIAGAATFQLVAGLQEAEMIRKQAELTKKINKLNADAIDLDAYEVERQGYEEVANYEGVIKQTVGDQRAAWAASNVDVNSGIAQEIQGETKLTGFLNTLQIQNQARARALGIRRQARNVRMQGEMQEAASNLAAQGAQTGALLNAGGTAISGYAKR